jgi:nucleosome binding factor SPN SPT16 subunit
MDLPYSESRMNLKWPQILKTISEDAAGFFEDGGWKNVVDIGSDVRDRDPRTRTSRPCVRMPTCVSGETGWQEEAGEEEEEEEDDEESDSEFAMSEDDESSEDSDDDYDDEDEEESEEEEEDASEDEGKDWDELERDAAEGNPHTRRQRSRAGKH